MQVCGGGSPRWGVRYPRLRRQEAMHAPRAACAAVLRRWRPVPDARPLRGGERVGSHASAIPSGLPSLHPPALPAYRCCCVPLPPPLLQCWATCASRACSTCMRWRSRWWSRTARSSGQPYRCGGGGGGAGGVWALGSAMRTWDGWVASGGSHPCRPPVCCLRLPAAPREAPARGEPICTRVMLGHELFARQLLFFACAAAAQWQQTARRPHYCHHPAFPGASVTLFRACSSPLLPSVYTLHSLPFPTLCTALPCSLLAHRRGSCRCSSPALTVFRSSPFDIHLLTLTAPSLLAAPSLRPTRHGAFSLPSAPPCTAPPATQ